MMEQATKWIGPEKARVIEGAESAVREVARLYLTEMRQAGKLIDVGPAVGHLTGGASLAQIMGHPTLAEAFRQAAMHVAMSPNAASAMRSIAHGG